MHRGLRLVLGGEEDVEVIAEGRGSTHGGARGERPSAPRACAGSPDARRIQHRADPAAPLTGARDPSRRRDDGGWPGVCARCDRCRRDGFRAQAIRDARPSGRGPVRRGEQYVSAWVGARLDALQRSVDDDGLSPREVDVLRLIALGLTSAEISDRLYLSRRTVESHRRRIHRKLGLVRRSELAEYALGRGLIRG